MRSNKLFDLIAGIYLRLLNTEFYLIYGIDPMIGVDLLVNAFISGIIFVIDPVEIVAVSLSIDRAFCIKKNSLHSSEMGPTSDYGDKLTGDFFVAAYLFMCEILQYENVPMFLIGNDVLKLLSTFFPFRPEGLFAKIELQTLKDNTRWIEFERSNITAIF